MPWLLLAVLSLWVTWVRSDLPAGCARLDQEVISTYDVTSFYEENDELDEVMPPSRIGAWRASTAIPTQHFAVNQARPGAAPIRQMPFSVVLSNEGATYEAYTLDRWNQSARSDEMQQQTPSKVDEPWNKVLSLGTNMKQVVSAPDGTPTSDFTGRSGIQVGMLGSGDPTWTGFGEMWADFVYQDQDDGQMEVLMVRGSALQTHRYTNADPVLVPYCLSSVNGVPASYGCPTEFDVADGGSGFLEGSYCSGGVLHIILRATKRLDVNQVQWAATTMEDWESSRVMTTCGSECEASDDGLRIDITVTGASGVMAFAINAIGRYLVPQDWVNNPATASCTGRKPPHAVADNPPQSHPATTCDPDICHTPSCNPDGSNFQLVVELTDPITGLDQIQFAVDTTSNWGPAPMLTCSSPDVDCDLSPDNRVVTYRNSFTGGSINYALNVIGRFVKPSDWTNDPYVHQCGQEPPPVTTPPPGVTTIDPGPTAPPGFCQDVPSLSPCPQRFCKLTFCAAAGGGEDYFKLLIQLDEEVDDIDEIQVAMNTFDDWDNSHPMITCTPDRCSLEPDRKTLVYCTTVPSGPIKYAVNIVGRFIQPPTDWETQPFQVQCGGSGTEVSTGSKFILELNEPGNLLPDQTRKYVTYFNEEMRAISDANGLTFVPVSGGKFSGILQLGYVGSGPRGDTSNAEFLDGYAGVFPYHPETTYCAQEGSGFINWDWNKHNVNGPTESGDLLMIAMSHHEPLIENLGPLINTPYTFRGLVGDYWLMEEPLPRSSLHPTPEGVQRVQENPEWLQNVLAGLDRDTSGQNLELICSISDSYGVGKEIAMVTRAASISRAFGTNHYQQLDDELRSCLEKWLRVDDSLRDGNKFRYDTVYGGLLLRAVDEGEPIDPGAYFGFPIYADHHFHLGYFIYALAYYVEFYPAWRDAHLERILAVARDVGNPSRNDELFPVVRHKDWYLGISWASGIGPGVRQAESSTEAINCYHALAALGEALGHEAMERTNQIQLATEIRSVREYYHVREHNRHLYPQYIKEYGTIGQFAETNIFLYTLNWPCDPFEFPMRHACLVGIQIIPIISVSGLYMDQEWASAVNNVCTWANDPWSAPGADEVDQEILRPVSTGWGAFCHSITAQYSDEARDDAEEFVKELSPSNLVGGTGVASTLLYIYAAT